MRDGGEREARNQVAKGDGLALAAPSARRCKKPYDIFWPPPRLAKRGNARVAVAFCQAATIRSDDKRDVAVSRGREAECALDENLRRCRWHQVVSADDFRYAHGGVVNDDGERVSGAVGIARNRKVA